MIDLRPIASGWPVEILTKTSELFVGRLDDSDRSKTDSATNRAIMDAVRSGWFRKEYEDSYDYAYYWDSVEKMKAFIEEDWSETAFLSNDVADEAQRLLLEAGAGAEIRIRRNMVIARYRKLNIDW